ncbi:MAG: glycosyltransferase family 2 protein [Acutalibacteraceae bacterium]
MLYKNEINHEIAVSVVVPVYNAEKDLRKCLDSVVCQTLKNIEIILINDGSKDGSAEICLEYKEKDPRIIYYYKENEGLAAARQDGMERAHGEFVGFVDSDDWIEPDMYERMYNAAKKENADVVFCGIFADENEKNPVYLEPGVYDRERIEKEILPRSLGGLTEKGSNSVIRWSNCSRIYSMDLIKKYEIAFDRRFRRSQDLQLTFETALFAQRYVSMCDEYLYHNRTVNNGESLSRGYTKNFWPLYRPLIDRLYEDVGNYKKQDLSYNMDLCTFFFAASGVRNEYYISKQKRKEKTARLDEIAGDEVLQKALTNVPANKLNKFYNAVYCALITKDGKKAYRVMKHYDFREKYVLPVVRKILNNRYVDVVYRKIRGK